MAPIVRMTDTLHFNTLISGNGPALIWGHGLMSSMAHEDACGFFDWQVMSSAIRLLRYDARGHGGSAMTADPNHYHWSALARDMIDVAASAGLERFAAGGRSMGSATAIYAGLKHPEKITRLVLVNPPTAWETRGTQEEIFGRMADLVEKRGIGPLIKAVRAFPSMPQWQLKEKPELTELFVRTLEQYDPQSLITVLRGATRCDLPPDDRIEALAMPALILAWVDDAAHPVASARRLAALMPNSELVISQSMAAVSQWSRYIVDFISG